MSTWDSLRSLQWIAPVAALSGAVLLGAVGDPRATVAVVATVWGLVVGVAWVKGRLPPGPAWAWAAAVRLPLLLCAPTLSDDAWRYVWEGEVWRAGFSPFVHAPDDPVLAHLRSDVWAHVNHRSVPTVYPPLAQALFALLAPGGVFAWRVFSALCDIGTASLLARRDRAAGLLWALLPLPALETAVSGHLEGPGLLLVVLALGGRGWAAWAATLVKLLPGVLLWRRWGWAALAVAACLVVMRPEGLDTYQAKWAYNASLFALLEPLGRPVVQALGAAIVGGILWRSRDPARVALWTFGAFVALSPVVHPWYVLWPLAVALWTGSRAWVVLATLVPFSYVVLATYDPASSAWTEPLWARWVVYPPFYAALIAEGWARWTRPGPWPVH